MDARKVQLKKILSDYQEYQNDRAYMIEQQRRADQGVPGAYHEMMAYISIVTRSGEDLTNRARQLLNEPSQKMHRPSPANAMEALGLMQALVQEEEPSVDEWIEKLQRELLREVFQEHVDANMRP